MTKATTTKDWLAAPNGNLPGPEYSLIQWVGLEADGKALVAEPVIDYAKDRPTPGIVPVMMVVKNGTLYTVNIHRRFNIDESPVLGHELMNALTTFQAEGLVVMKRGRALSFGIRLMVSLFACPLIGRKRACRFPMIQSS